MLANQRRSRTCSPNWRLCVGPTAQSQSDTATLPNLTGQAPQALSTRINTVNTPAQSDAGVIRAPTPIVVVAPRENKRPPDSSRPTPTHGDSHVVSGSYNNPHTQTNAAAPFLHEAPDGEVSSHQPPWKPPPRNHDRSSTHTQDVTSQIGPYHGPFPDNDEAARALLRPTSAEEDCPHFPRQRRQSFYGPRPAPRNFLGYGPYYNPPRTGIRAASPSLPRATKSQLAEDRRTWPQIYNPKDRPQPNKRRAQPAGFEAASTSFGAQHAGDAETPPDGDHEDEKRAATDVTAKDDEASEPPSLPDLAGLSISGHSIAHWDPYWMSRYSTH